MNDSLATTTPSRFSRFFRRDIAALDAMRQNLLQEKAALAQQALELKSKMDLGRIHDLSPSQLVPNPDQPRKVFSDTSLLSLSESIMQYGILQPLTVRPLDSATAFYDPSTRFALIAGERRLRAAQLAGLLTVPCIIIDADAQKSAALALIENLQREDLNMFEQASAIAALIDLYHLTQEQAAKRLSVSQSFVANKLRMLRLEQSDRDYILHHGLSERHVRALLRIGEVDKRRTVMCTVATRHYNVAQTEEYVEEICRAEAHPSKQKPKSRFILKDIRLFYNTVDQALSLVRRAGIAVHSERKETDGGVCWTIRIPDPRSAAPAAKS